MESVFYYGVMKASKSAQLILKASTYRVQGIEPIIIKPSIDTRDDLDKIQSRIGIKMPVTYNVKPDAISSIIHIISIARHENRPIFVDEAQFFSSEAIETLISVVNDSYEEDNTSNVNVYLFGLLKNYHNKLFNGSKTIVERVDKLVEIKTKCEVADCGRKATCNYLENTNDTDGDILIGDSQYKVFCQRHYAKKMHKQLWGDNYEKSYWKLLFKLSW